MYLNVFFLIIKRVQLNINEKYILKKKTQCKFASKYAGALEINILSTFLTYHKLLFLHLSLNHTILTLNDPKKKKS